MLLRPGIARVMSRGISQLAEAIKRLSALVRATH
jgi:hypothetical protein